MTVNESDQNISNYRITRPVMNDGSPVIYNAYTISNKLEYNDKIVAKGSSPSLRKSKDNGLSTIILNQKVASSSPCYSKLEFNRKKKNEFYNQSIDVQDQNKSFKVTSNIVKDSSRSNKLVVYKTIASNKGQQGNGLNSTQSQLKSSVVNRDN